MNQSLDDDAYVIKLQSIQSKLCERRLFLIRNTVFSGFEASWLAIPQTAVMVDR